MEESSQASLADGSMPETPMIDDSVSKTPKIEGSMSETPIIDSSMPDAPMINGSHKVGKETLRDKLSSQVYRSRVIHSIWLSASSFTLGIIFGQQGPTFLDLQIITGTDVESASFFFTAASFGYMVGSFVSGFLHGKVNNNVLMCIINCGAGVAAIITPYCSPYPLMIVFRFLTNMFCGAIDTLVNAEHMHIWGKEGRALLQFIHFVFALGGVVTPLITEPFLAAKGAEHELLSSVKNLNVTVKVTDGIAVVYNETHSHNQTGYGVAVVYNETHSHNQTGDSFGRPLTTNVHYAFLIAGLIAVMIAVPYVILIFIDKRSESSSENKYTQKLRSRQLPLPMYIFMLVVLCFFYVVYCCIEDTFASFLMTFVVREYESVTKSQGAYITMFYWASFAAARFGSIFVSSYLTAVRSMHLYCFLMVVAYTGFTLSAVHAHIDSLTAFACMAGISMSGLFPAGFSWTEAELFPVTGWVSSYILIGSSLGMMVNPMIVGFLMKHVSNMWFCYILLGEALLLSVVFFFLLMFNRCYINKIYGTVANATSLEITVDASKTDADTSEITVSVKC
ncbi:unnamed protein product [Candidula unifasciata]|uniref:Sodium-dependent glucose transporter 1 n=1 Tax=Candidula unifasciata TaxID=100452 RepID=A0A8S3ZIY3_9EUPU|nr:unnamed protein product [Candidula unifasciata]